MADLGIISNTFIDEGLFGLSILKPYELFGMTGMDAIAHATFWSLLFNTLFYVLGSLYSRPTALEQAQGNLFVDIYNFEMRGVEPKIVGSSASFTDIRLLLNRFLGEKRADKLLKDYAKRHKLEQATLELQEANIQLQEVDRLKDEFITTVTHELRTLMTSIRSFSNILYSKEDLDPQRKQEFLSIIIKESERITRLINQVLDLEKMESGHAKWEIEELDFCEVSRLAAKSMQTWIEEENINFQMTLPDDAVIVEGDFDRLVQVVVNLLSNAVKFCDEAAGEVSLALAVKGNCCCLQVKDNGIGIAVEDQVHIFNKFTQLSEYKSGRQQGSGLGLSISQRIVQHHKGSIWVESELGKGSSFFLELPIFKRSFEF